MSTRTTGQSILVAFLSAGTLATAVNAQDDTVNSRYSPAAAVYPAGQYSTINRATLPTDGYPSTRTGSNPAQLLPPEDFEDFDSNDEIDAAHDDPYNSPGYVIPVNQSPEFDRIPNPPVFESEQPQTYALPPEASADEHPQLFSQPAGWISRKSSRVTATWLPAGADEIGMSDVDIRAGWTLDRSPGVTITPGFQVHFLDGPTRTDLPARLYNARADVEWKKQWSARWASQLGIAPGVYSDFDTSSSDALRIVGRALAIYAHSPTTQFVFGAVYLDREDVRALPAIGLVHAPNAHVRLELIFPKPRIAYLVNTSGCTEHWAYLAGEFGGGSWAIQRVTGVDDVATYRDWRIILGVERKNTNGPSMLVEGAFVFNRQLEYKSGIGDFDPDASGMLRAGVTF